MEPVARSRRRETRATPFFRKTAIVFPEMGHEPKKRPRARTPCVHAQYGEMPALTSLGNEDMAPPKKGLCPISGEAEIAARK